MQTDIVVTLTREAPAKRISAGTAATTSSSTSANTLTRPKRAATTTQTPATKRRRTQTSMSGARSGDAQEGT